LCFLFSRLDLAPYLIVLVTIFDETCTHDRSLLLNPLTHSNQRTESLTISSSSLSSISSAPSRSQNSSDVYFTLMGNRTAASQVLLDLEGRRGLYFIFSDLNVRIPGIFRLKFVLTDIRWKVS